VSVPEAELTDLRRRITATKFPERETVNDMSQGVPLPTVEKLARYGSLIEQLKISTWNFDTLVGGHVARTGTRADVTTQLAFMDDLKNAAETALKTTSPGEGLNDTDRSGNPWAVFDHYIDHVSLAGLNQLTPKWSTRLAAYDVYIWDQCLAMEQSLRID